MQAISTLLNLDSDKDPLPVYWEDSLHTSLRRISHSLSPDDKKILFHYRNLMVKLGDPEITVIYKRISPTTRREYPIFGNPYIRSFKQFANDM